MITYVSHIGVTYNWPKDNLDLKKTHFKKYFKKKKIVNNKCKKKFLRNNEKFHDIIFYKNKNWNFGLEIINYKKNYDNQNLNSINDTKTTILNLVKINKFKNLSLHSSNILSDYKFFEKMGLLLNIKITKKKFFGNLPNFKKKKAQLFVKKKINRQNLYLDDLGLNFISFFSTDIKNDIKKINKNDIKLISNIFKIRINNNSFRLVLIRTLGGIIIELIEKI